MPAAKIKLDAAELLKLKSEGHTNTEISHMYGCSFNTVKRRLKEIGFVQQEKEIVCRICKLPFLGDDKACNGNIHKICLSQYHKDWHNANSERAKETKKRWNSQNPDKIYQYNRKKQPQKRERHYSSSYGISSNEVDLMVKKQQGLCAICKSPPKTHLVLDHNHETGKIREMLCIACNFRVGWAETLDITIFDYLKKHDGNI